MARDVLDPLTGEVDRPLAPPSPAELEALAVRLRARHSAWSTADRGGTLLQFADALANDDQVVPALSADTGRVAESALERQLTVDLLRHWAQLGPALLSATEDRPSSTLPFVTIGTRRQPYPLVGAITPWNFPLLLGLIDAIPALAAGCAVLVKPSEVTPRFIEPLMRLIPPALPLHIVEGGAETGAAIIDLVDAIAFTGSVATGRTVAEQAARAFIPASLELGGKDPAIVLEGADLDRAATAILWGGTANAGQNCMAVERVYVLAPIYERFVSLLADKAAKIGLTCEGGPIGPMIDSAQAGVVERHLADAVDRGAVVHTGGRLERHGGGRWFRPTVLTSVSHDMLVMREETFGPILPVMSVSDVDEAVDRANDTEYGLSASVFGPTEEAARAVADRLNAGAVSINDANLLAFIYESEVEPHRMSGIGPSRMGPTGLLRFTRQTTYHINRSADPDPWWHPSP